MNSKTIDNIKIFMCISSISIILLITILFWIEETIGFQREITIAFIGAFGSIIGGALTLIGVKWTIDKQKAEGFVEKYPNKINNLDSSIQDISKILNMRIYLFSGRIEARYQGQNLYLKELINELIRHSIEVDGIVYTEASSLKYKINGYIAELHADKYNSYEDEYTDSLSECSESERQKYGLVISKEIKQYHNRLLEHREKFEKQFKRYLELL
ncbi:hypothetical protein [Paenibacillus radicis (ex Xue et al. 2023)]|uniref:DUF4760 domain-containing protein n=1 Tax=Paenibacillus radicis (ex Xue et al. 2023) TaxID=2972489 RepID=A0ABT1YJY1_9BACL|nr:hypothetical protein [Paenibacillus radicis (ex Xue et al. 2023)]MCR8633474.1 hypothetical protein [Paenibacillus radicis (ex Xue et al. 2023)]